MSHGVPCTSGVIFFASCSVSCGCSNNSTDSATYTSRDSQFWKLDVYTHIVGRVVLSGSSGGIVPGLPLPCTLARSPLAPCSMGLHPSLGLHRHVLLSLCLMLDLWSTLLHSDLTLTSHTCSDPASKSRHVLRSQDVHFARQYSAQCSCFQTSPLSLVVIVFSLKCLPLTCLPCLRFPAWSLWNLLNVWVTMFHQFWGVSAFLSLVFSHYLHISQSNYFSHQIFRLPVFHCYTFAINFIINCFDFWLIL